jgi:aldose 1-epimerase
MRAEPEMSSLSHIQSPDGRLSLEYAPEAGGSIASFRLKRAEGDFDLFRPYDSALPLHPLNMASFPLTPYSNRIIDCRLSFEGETLRVGPKFGAEPNQLHGDGWQLPWRVEEEGKYHVTLSLKTSRREESPYVYEAKQTYRLDDGGLAIDMAVINRSGRRLPFGLGHHPYFLRNDKTTLKARMPKVWRSRGIVPEKLEEVPRKWDFSRGIALADAHFEPAEQGFAGTDLLDHCFQGWNGTAEITWPDEGLALVMQADPVFANFVLYIPHRKNFFCAEAVTNVIDGFNLMARGAPDTGTVILDEGGTLSGSTWFRIREI